MKITRTEGQHIGLPGDRVDYYPQAEARGEEFNVVVLPAEDEAAPAWTGEKAAARALDYALRIVASARRYGLDVPCVEMLAEIVRDRARVGAETAISAARRALTTEGGGESTEVPRG